MSDTKALGRVEVKDADLGQVTAVFSTLDVIDLDGDVTVKGAFTEGAEVRISAYGHASWSGALPVGKGVIREEGDVAVLDGQFFLDTVAGRDTFTVVKELGGMQEWSYGFDVVDAERGQKDGRDVRILKALRVHEVSPVMIGAGVGTRTLGAKSAPESFTDEAERVLVLLEGLVGRADDVMAMRRSKGKGLGESTAELLARVKARADELTGLLTAPADPSTSEQDFRAQAALLHAAHLSTLRRIA